MAEPWAFARGLAPTQAITFRAFSPRIIETNLETASQGSASAVAQKLWRDRPLPFRLRSEASAGQAATLGWMLEPLWGEWHLHKHKKSRQQSFPMQYVTNLKMPLLRSLLICDWTVLQICRAYGADRGISACICGRKFYPLTKRHSPFGVRFGADSRRLLLIRPGRYAVSFK